MVSNNRSYTTRRKWGTKIFIGLSLVLALSLGVAFEKTAERYAYRLIDTLWSLKSQNECSESQLLAIKTRSREPVRSKDLIETNDSWKVVQNEHNFCPKNVAILLIDVWETESEKNDIVRIKNTKIAEEVITPIVDKVRRIGGVVVHSPNGSPMYPNIYDNTVDINLSWTHRLPRKLQTIALFWTLRARGVETIIYAGFSTNICLYDRPHGIYFTRLFDDYFTRVLMRDATSTWEFSNRKASFTENFINYLEWHHLPSFVSTDFF